MNVYKPVDDLFQLFNAAGLWISKDVTSCTFSSALSQRLSPLC